MSITDKILSIDPSSSTCGYAVFAAGGKLIDAGLAKPHRATDVPNTRIDAMIADLIAVVDEHQPDVIVIEDTSGRVYKRHGAGGGRGLAIYGKAIGEVRRAMIHTGRRVVMVLEDAWTGKAEKSKRLRWVAAAYPQYKPADDPGGDMGDAIGLGYWYRNAAAMVVIVEKAGTA